MKFEESMLEMIRKDGRYSVDAFEFLYEGLTRAVKQAYGEQATGPKQRHVSASQLCHALRDLAVEKWSVMARTVLAKWNVNSTMDFGNMVFLLVQHDFMRRTEEDSLEDFRDVFDFQQGFDVEIKADPKE